MAEYVLKIDVDESALKQKIERIFGNTGTIKNSGNSSKNPVTTESMEKIMKDSVIGRYGPQLMKIGGFAAGLTGILQFRKMLIDSSPVLQGTLKILQTTFELALRPLGDFIGMFFMPMAIGLLHAVVPWYRDHAQVMGEYYLAGKQFFSGDLQGAWETILSALQTIQQNTSAREYQDYTEGLPTDGPGRGVYGDILKDTIHGFRLMWQDFTELLTNAFSKLPTQIQQPFLLFIGKLNEFFLLTVPNAWETFTTQIGSAWSSIVDFFSGIASDITGRITTAWYAVTAIFSSMGATVQSIIAPTWNRIANITIDIANAIDSAWKRLESVIRSLRNNPVVRSTAQLIGAATTSFRAATDPLFASIQSHVDPNTGYLRPLAGGGVISEPIMGIGRSGQRYSLGESGPERVTPLGGNDEGSGGNVTINVYGVTNISDFEGQVRPLVLQWLKESGSRRGIL